MTSMIRFGSGMGLVESSTQKPNDSNLPHILQDYSNPLDITAVRVLIVALYGTVFITCITGNILLLAVIALHKRMRTITNFFLANLAVTDLCVGVFCIIPNMSTYLSPYWKLGRVMCKASYFVQSMSYTASLSILTVISVERYVAIIYPMHSRRLRTVTLLRATIIGVWIVAAASGLPYVFMYDLIPLPNYPTIGRELNNTTDDDITTAFGGVPSTPEVPVGVEERLAFCMQVGQQPFSGSTTDTTTFVVWYVIPLVAMAFFYSRISVVLWRSSEVSASSGAVSRQRIRFVVADTQTSVSLITQMPNTVRMHDENEEPTRIVRTSAAKTHRMRPFGYAQRATSACSGIELDNCTSSSTVDCDEKSKSTNHTTVTSSRDTSERCLRYERIETEQHVDNKKPEIPSTRRSLLTAKTSESMSARTISTVVDSHGESALGARRKVIRLLIALVVSFAVCVLPYHMRFMWLNYGKPSIEDWHAIIAPFTFVMYYLNSALNPLLYAFLSNKFRSSLVDLFPVIRCRTLNACCGRCSTRSEIGGHRGWREEDESRRCGRINRVSLQLKTIHSDYMNEHEC